MSSPAAAYAPQWGPAYWRFLHVLAQSVDPARFAQDAAARADLLQALQLVFARLPCPDCRAHARAHVLSVRWDALRTRRDLQLMLFFFHNKVNRRKGLPLFPMAQLPAHYAGQALAECGRAFLAQMARPVPDLSFVQDNTERAQAAARLGAWLQARLADGTLRPLSDAAAE